MSASCWQEQTMTSTFSNATFGDSRPLSTFLDQLSSEKKFDQIRSYRELILDDECKLLDCGASFTKRGLEALCKFANMPASMLDWMIRKDYKPELAKFVNSELIGLTFEDEQTGRPSKRVFSRFREDDYRNTVCRALFSDRYAILDASMLMQMVASALSASELDAAVINRLEYNGDELVCNLVWPGSDRIVGGESYVVGISIQTSEIGTIRMQVNPWIGRLVCANGLIVNTPCGQGISKRHIGRIDHQELAANVRLTVGSALAQADQALWQLDSARKVELKSPERIIIEIGKENRLTTDQIKRWIAGHKATLMEPSVDTVSAFSVVNGLTYSARQSDVSSIERVHLEALAGRLVAPKLETTFADIEAAWQKTEMKANLLSDEVVSAYEI
jgi:hypothetical protein